MELTDLYYWYLDSWKKYAQFKGRSNRVEFLVFLLGNMAIAFIWYELIIIFHGNLVHSSAPVSPFSMDFVSVFTIAGMIGAALAVIPCIAVTARRFHDIGRSGWFSLGLPIIIVGLPFFLLPIFVLILGYFKGQKETNKYGSNPNATQIDEIDSVKQSKQTQTQNKEN